VVAHEISLISVQTGTVLHRRDPDAAFAALAELADRAQAAGLRVRLPGDLPGGLPPAVDLAVYRILQESLTNSLRHAWATEVAVDIHRTTDEMCLDNADRTATVDPAAVCSGRGGRWTAHRDPGPGG
jgi:signal transduction histidine kinase